MVKKMGRFLLLREHVLMAIQITVDQEAERQGPGYNVQTKVCPL